MIHVKQDRPPDPGPRGPGSSRFGRPESARSTNRRQEPLRNGGESGGGSRPPRRQLHVGLICRRSGCRHCESPRTVPLRATLACRTSPRSRRPDPTTRRARRLRNTRPRHARTTTRVPIESTRHRCGPSSTTERLGGGGPPALLDASREGYQGRVARPGCRRPSASRPSASSGTPCLRGAPTTWLYSPPGSRAAPSRRLRSGTVVTGTGEGRIITLIHVKHVGRRIGRHADATSVGLNAGFCCHSDETAGGPLDSQAALPVHPVRPCRLISVAQHDSGLRRMDSPNQLPETA